MQFEQMTAGRGALTAVRTGQGRDLVILHSLLADRHAFDLVLEALAAKHRVTLLNLPGFHGSQPAMLALMDAYLATIEDGFDEFEIAKDAILLGKRIRRHHRAGLRARASRTDFQAGGERCRGRLSSGRTTGLRGDG